jgi:hypothetical protein
LVVGVLLAAVAAAALLSASEWPPDSAGERVLLTGFAAKASIARRAPAEDSANAIAARELKKKNLNEEFVFIGA